jgi:hypothetical protein
MGTRVPISISTIASRYLVLIATTLGVFLIGVSRPLHGWDMIGYVASAYQLDGYSDRELLNKTFGDVRASVDDDTFKILTEGEGKIERTYREAIYSDPKALSQQIPFYSIKIAFVEITRLSGHLWPHYSKLSYMISATFAALAVVVLAGIVTTARIPFIMLPLVVFASGLPELARASSPDSMAVFFSLLCILSFMWRGVLVFAVAAILPLIRTDLLILSVLMMLIEFGSGRRVAAAAAVLLSVAAYVWVNWWAGNYGWATLVHVSTDGPSPYPAEMKDVIVWKDLIRAYIFVIYDFAVSGYFAIYIVATYLGWKRVDWASEFRPEKAVSWLDKRAPLALYIVPTLYLVLHLMLFPHFEYRYFVFSAALVFVSVLTLGVAGVSEGKTTRLARIWQHPSSTEKSRTYS